MNNRTVKNIIPACGADFIMPFILVYMFYIIFHGHPSPGGGFQGGVLMVSVVVFLYLGHGYKTTTNALSLHFMHGTEGFASIMYIAFAMIGVAFAGNFCYNALSQYGNIGDLYSSGTIFWMNLTVGLKVVTGIGSITLMMLALVADRKGGA